MNKHHQHRPQPRNGYVVCYPVVALVFVVIFLALPQIVSSAEIGLAWDSNAESDVAGYKIYYGTASGKYTHSINVGNVTQATLNLPKKKYYISLTAYDTYGNESGYSNEVSWPIQLFEPNGGEILHPFDSSWIQWSAPSEAVSFTLYYSLDNGKTWNTIQENVAGSSYNWTVPTPPNNRRKCLVRVVGYDGSGKQFGSDKSDANFTLEVVELLSPNESGEILYSGESYPISWEVYETWNPVAQVEVFYTKDGGASWNLIESLNGSLENYNWLVPTVRSAKNECKVKVVLKDVDGRTVGADSSDAFFTIQP
jgi:hypothetical protein